MLPQSQPCDTGLYGLRSTPLHERSRGGITTVPQASTLAKFSLLPPPVLEKPRLCHERSCKSCLVWRSHLRANACITVSSRMGGGDSDLMCTAAPGQESLHKGRPFVRRQMPGGRTAHPDIVCARGSDPMVETVSHSSLACSCGECSSTLGCSTALAAKSKPELDARPRSLDKKSSTRRSSEITRPSSLYSGHSRTGWPSTSPTATVGSFFSRRIQCESAAACSPGAARSA